MNGTNANGMNQAPDIERVICKQNKSDGKKVLTAPFAYLQSLPGNNSQVRSKFLTGFNERYFYISNAKAIGEIGAIVEILHGASLLIDDIEDGSTFRRGKCCAHIKFGMPSTLNSGNFMYFVAFQRALSTLPKLIKYDRFDDDSVESDIVLFKSRLSDIFMEEMINLHGGQGYDIYWRDNLQEVIKSGLPSIEEYLEVAMHKTGGLFRLAVRTLNLVAKTEGNRVSLSSKDLIKLANLLGIIYQIRDDYLNLVDERYAESKGVASEDLIEGKLSFPILHTLLHKEPGSILHQLYAKHMSPDERRADLENLRQARAFIADSGALQYTYCLLQSYIEKARGIIGTGSSSDTLLELLTRLSQVSQPADPSSSSIHII